MKVYNEDKTKELIEYDIALGYLKNDKILIKHNDEVKENIVYKTTVFSNGGISKVPDMEKSILAKKAYDEYEDIQIYVPYTESEIKNRKIAELKAYLDTTWRWKKERFDAEVQEIALRLPKNNPRILTTQTQTELITDRLEKVAEINRLEGEVQ